MTATGIGTQMVRVRAQYDTGPMSIIDAQDYLYDLSCLMLTGYMLGATPPLDRDIPGLSMKEAASVAIRAANDTHVRSINYNSPLEVILTLSSASVAVTLVGERIVRLFREIQETRAVTASVNTRVMRERIVQRHLEQYLSLSSPDEQVARWIAGAARAGSDIKQFEIEPDYE